MNKSTTAKAGIVIICWAAFTVSAFTGLVITGVSLLVWSQAKKCNCCKNKVNCNG